MADATQLEILNKGVAAWNEWRVKNPKILINLRGANLRGANLRGANLRGANLSGAHLVAADLQGADLSEADLHGAELHGTNLSGAHLRRAGLSEANLCKAALTEAHLSEADLRGAYLSGAHLSKAHLSRANLSRAHLGAADLHGADLSEANLHGAELHGANLSEAHLSGAELSEAELSKATLSRANLRGANLRGANLSEADLCGANLSEADLRGAVMLRSHLDDTCFSSAILGNTNLALTSLKTTRGLETCEHFHPSAIDFHTLMESGPLAEVFLRGCGLSDEYIRYLPSFRDQPFQLYSCFISYSHADKAFARRLHDALQGRGVRCWLDEHQLLPGDHIYDAIDRGIRSWDKILLCCSEASLKDSWWVENEIQIALKKEQELRKARGAKVLALIPLNLDGYLLSGQWQSGLSTQITSRLAADFTGWDKDNAKFETQFERVVKALRADGGGREPAPRSRL